MRPLMVLMLLAGGATSAAAQTGDRYVRGREVELQLVEPKAKIKGELLAVGPDTAWVLVHSGDSVLAVPARRITGGKYRRHGFTSETAIGWGLVMGVASGAALTAACSSVAEGCGGVFVGMTVSSGVIGLLAASTTRSAKGRFSGYSRDQLARLARFPNGRPLGLEWSALNGQR